MLCSILRSEVQITPFAKGVQTADKVNVSGHFFFAKKLKKQL